MRCDLGLGRGCLNHGAAPEDHPASLGAYNLYHPVEAFYETCDAILVVGSRLRSNETLKYKLKLPSPFYQVDVDPDVHNRPYRPGMLVLGDSQLVLEALADRLDGQISIDKWFRIQRFGHVLSKRISNEMVASGTHDNLYPFNKNIVRFFNRMIIKKFSGTTI